MKLESKKIWTVRKIRTGTRLQRILLLSVGGFSIMVLMSAMGFALDDEKLACVFSTFSIIAGTLAYRAVATLEQSPIHSNKENGLQK
jgi:hypothetical protein